TSTASAGKFNFDPPGRANGVYDFAVVGVDNVGNETPIPAGGADSTVYDTLRPQVALTLLESNAYAYVDGDTVYYGAGSGSFTARAQVGDATSGLGSVTFPGTVSLGDVYAQGGVAEAIQNHLYAFTPASTAEGDYQVVVTDLAGHEAEASFTLVRDVAPPQVSVDATVEDSIVTVSWDASDGGSGLNVCTLKVREGDGEWQTFSTDCVGTDTYSPSLGETCTFHLDAHDNTGNQASAEDATGVSRVTKYYYAGGRRVAMRAGGVVYYLHNDHLGSTSLTTDESGGVTARQLYYPYGEVRWGEGASATDFGFTGQRSVAGTGLVFMHARFYNPRLGRFVSADTIVPGAADSAGGGLATIGYSEQTRLTPLTVG
ncbi:MAG: RHS repeat-associated core domain-containing protein, partial [bacterium]|nr:RHS repeat-associated core domain-containing protein [bacterium]